MKLTQLDFALIVLLAAGGFYLFKTRGELASFKSGYNALSDQLVSGRLITNPSMV